MLNDLNPKNIVLVLCDGMGVNVINHFLNVAYSVKFYKTLKIYYNV